MIKLLLAILMIGLNACSSQQTKTNYATYQPPVVIDQVPRAIANQQLKHHSILPKKNYDWSNEIAQQEKLLPRIASYIKQGVASWYGPGFHGKKTATGEIFDMYAMTAAHKTLPIPSYAQVTNLENNRSIIVRINDRGPFVRNREMDLSYAAAKHSGYATKRNRINRNQDYIRQPGTAAITTNCSRTGAGSLSASGQFWQCEKSHELKK